MKGDHDKYIIIIPISWSFHEGFFKDFPKTFAKKICPVYGHSPPYFYRAHHPRAGVLLPNLSFQNHRCGRTGTLQHGPSGIRHLFCLMRRFHPDGHLPVCGLSLIHIWTWFPRFWTMQAFPARLEWKGFPSCHRSRGQRPVPTEPQPWRNGTMNSVIIPSPDA